MLNNNWEDKQGINLPTHTPCLNNNLTGPSTKINVATLTSSGSNFQDGRSRFHINQPTSIEPVSFKQQSDNQFHDQPNHSSETHAQQPAVDSNLQQLITFLSSKYGPMKTPLEIGTPEYMKLVEILKQSSVIGNGSSVEELSGSYSKDSLTNDIKNVETASFTEDNSSTCGNNQVKITSSEKNVEQLWEGSLQLSSSVTLSATAFFKSGEKLVGNHWPDFIEVKGKVRLEAFEKYVQDLPRSRTRGLMVISICWNEKSSSIGLNGMKEVAKGYKKSCKVGFAQLLSGIDLYICPRSDPIITILAKYGFFKGMSVIDDKPDSMIGCVVWRKNRPLNPVTNKSDDKNSPNFTESQNSPPGFSSKQQTEKSESSQHDKPLTSPLTLPLTSACVEVDRDRVCSSSSSSPLMDSVNLVVKKRSFQDDDLPEFDFFGGKSTVASKPIKSPEKLVNSQLTRIPLVTNAMPEWVPPKANNQLPPENNNSNNNNNNGSLKQLLKKTKLFDDDDMPEWRPPEVHNQQPPQNTTSTFQNLPLYPPLPPFPRPQPPHVQLPPPPPPPLPPLQPPPPLRPVQLPPPPPVQPPPPPPPLRPQPPRADTRSSFYNQPFRPLVSSQPPVFLRPPPQPLPPPPQLRPQPPHPSSRPSGRSNSNQVLWHQPPFPPPLPNGRRPQL